MVKAFHNLARVVKSVSRSISRLVMTMFLLVKNYNIVSITGVRYTDEHVSAQVQSWMEFHVEEVFHVCNKNKN